MMDTIIAWIEKCFKNWIPDDNYRFLMRHFPQWIEQRMLSVIEGDLFLGLRRLIDENVLKFAFAIVLKIADLPQLTL